MDQRFYNLYDEYIHGFIERRSFLERLGRLAGGTAAATAILPMLENNMARAETVAESDARISAETVNIPGVTGLKGYLVKPKGGRAKKPAVIVIHENRGLNPHIKDVTRRFATEGFIALGVDYLSPIGGTPADQDKGAQMIGTLKPEGVVASSRAALAYLKGREDVNGKVGAVGFCWGGGAVGDLAVADPNLDAGVPYYGRQPAADRVAAIKAPLLIQYAGMDERINAGIPAFEAALKANKKPYQIFVYDGAQHGFNNDTSEARYNKPVAELAWKRTVDFFKKELA
jgi:carboxymethylenebutenolidase